MKLQYNHDCSAEDRAFFTRILLPYPGNYHAFISHPKTDMTGYPWKITLMRGEQFYFIEMARLDEGDLRGELDRGMRVIETHLEKRNVIRKRENDPEVSLEEYQKMRVLDLEMEGKKSDQIEQLMEKIEV